MVFSSMIFIWVFLPILFLIYFIVPKKFKNIVLLIFSLLFYAWGEPIYILLMLFSIVINYFLGLFIDKYKKQRKLFFIIDVIFNISLLGYFKYFNFFAININAIFGNELLSLRNIMLPIGISFYTFQILSYIIDLYRKEINVQRNIINLALYISFFPQLIAGPIVKYKDIEKEINDRKVDIDLFSYGIKRFVYGLGKKVIIANYLAYVVDKIYGLSINNLNTPLVWLAAILYTLQIYYDFSGYSDMAIGLGRMFGFHFKENFNYPYIASSITDFWRRWHISLSTWFKEYVYIPLGGNRKGKERTYINLIIVFFLTGLWHGANYNFIIWGLFHGLFILIERVFLKKYLDNNKFKVINYIYTLLIVIIGWVFFRIEDLNMALDIIKLMFSFNFNTVYIILPQIINIKTLIIIMLSILLSGPLQLLFKKIKIDITNMNSFFEILFIIAILFISTMELVSGTYNPFIYFRF